MGIVIAELIVRNPYYLRRILPRSWVPKLKEMGWTDWLRLIIVVGACTFAAMYLVNAVEDVLREEVKVETRAENYPFQRPPPPEPLPPLTVIISTTLPIAEEWIFRGVLLEEIMRRTRSKLIALIISSIIFGAFHLSNPGAYPALALPMTVSGIVLGVCYLLSGLGGAILSHTLYNVLVTFNLP